MIRKSALYHDADISDTIATTQHNITTKQQITHFPCSGYGGDAIASYSLQIKSQHNNITTQQPPTAVYNEKLPFLLEEEELIWLFSYEYCSFYVNRTNWEKFLSFVIVSLYNDFTSFIVSFKIQTLSHCRVTFYYSTCPSPASE